MSEEKKSNHKGKKIAFGIFFLVIIFGLVTGFFYVRYKKTHISTDDAFVEGSIYTVSARIDGTVQAVLVRDNQFVKKGQLILRLDREPYEKKVSEARAAVQAQKAALKELEAALSAQKRKVQAQKAELQRRLTQKRELEALLNVRDAELRAKLAQLKQSKKDLQRARALFEKGVIPEQRYDHARTAYETMEASVSAARELKRQAELKVEGFDKVILQARAALKAERAILKKLQASIKTQKGRLKRAEALLSQTELMLSYTNIYSPARGYITRKSIEPGEQIRAGQPLMAVVPPSGLYIIANYKETKIGSIKKGMKVRIKVDAYPELELWGVVDSIMAGTGASFSLFPPENATGNYVKVVQRIPVKIIIKEGLDSAHPLRVGMSVVPTVLVK